MSEEKPFYVVAPIPCPTCGKELLDYQRDDDPFWYCLNAEDVITIKVPKKV